MAFAESRTIWCCLDLGKVASRNAWGLCQRNSVCPRDAEFIQGLFVASVFYHAL